MTIHEIPADTEATLERAALALREARDDLSTLVGALDAELRQLMRARMTTIQAALRRAADLEADLRERVETSNPALWERKRTRTVHGIKFGWVKQRGRVEFDDEGKVIERIRQLLPAAQAELLIRTRESVHKPGVYDLTVADLKRLGVRVTADADQVTVSDVATDLTRMVERLLAEARAIQAEAEAEGMSA